MWPPEYTIRKSKRAKGVSLKISPISGLEIIIPSYYRRAVNVDNLINKNKIWINKNISIIQKASAPVVLPDEFNLQAINEHWKIKYFPTVGRAYCATSDTLNMIIVNYKSENKNIKSMLKKWLTKKASANLLPWLTALSKEVNLPFEKLNIRGQKTIWGSCDNKQTINLNYKLLFLPPNLVQHVMLHELIHTKYMNHGKRFYNLLYKLDINSDEHKHQLKTADNFIP